MDKLNNEYLISVIVPVYNTEKYLDKCLESIVNQTYTNLEILIIDDSTDNSSQICDSYAKKDRRVHVVHNEIRQGLVRSKKIGLEMATGDYIGFVDSDDYIDEVMYYELLKNMIETGADFAQVGDTCEIEGEEIRYLNYGEGIYELNDENRIRFIKEHFLNKYAKRCINTSMTNKLFQREFVKKCYAWLPDEKSDQADDSLCMMVAMLEAKKISALDKCHFHLVQHEGSVSRRDYTIKGLIDFHQGCEMIGEVLKKYNLYEELGASLEESYVYSAWHIYSKLIKDDFPTVFFRYPCIDELLGKRIVIYGAGNVGKDYYAQLRQYRQCEVVAWADTHYYKYNYRYSPVISKEEVKKFDFDILVIAVAHKELAETIREQLIEEGIDGAKIIWRMPCNNFSVKGLAFCPEIE
ncbi:MAG: glycosyltransferase [Lachnospiraceae bacterium]|nr:glycosyltransferase [Lachnospiraceae bacterium]